jgi:hypothetical protein
MKSVVFADPQLFFEKADTLVLSTLLNGEAVALSAASFVVYSGTETIKSGNCLVSNPGVITISFDGTEFDIPGRYRLQLSTTQSTGGAVMVTQHLFWVVRHKLIPMVSDAALESYYPQLDDELWAGETSWQDQIDQAFRDVTNQLYRDGYDGAFLVDAGQLNDAVAHKALAIIFRGFKRAEGDIWHVRQKEEEQDYDRIYSSLKLDIDKSLNGVPNEVTKMATIRAVR